MTKRRIILILLCIVLFLVTLPRIIAHWNKIPTSGDEVAILMWIVTFEEIFILFKKENH